jgi:hypothetical protein
VKNGQSLGCWSATRPRKVTHSIPFQPINSRLASFARLARGLCLECGEEDVPKVGAWRDKFAQEEKETAESDGLEIVAPWFQIHVRVGFGD